MSIDEVLRALLDGTGLLDAEAGANRELVFVLAQHVVDALVAGLFEELDGALAHYRDLVLPAMAAGTMWAWTLRLKSAPARIVGSAQVKGEPPVEIDAIAVGGVPAQKNHH